MTSEILVERNPGDRVVMTSYKCKFCESEFKIKLDDCAIVSWAERDGGHERHVVAICPVCYEQCILELKNASVKFEDVEKWEGKKVAFKAAAAKRMKERNYERAMSDDFGK